MRTPCPAQSDRNSARPCLAAAVRKRPRQRVLQRERQDEIARPPGRFDLAHEAVDDAARRPARERARDPRLIFVRVEDRLLVGVGDAGFLAREEGGAQAARRQRRAPAPPRCRGRP